MRNVPVGAGRRKNKTSDSNHYRQQLSVPESEPVPSSGFPTTVPCIPRSHWPYLCPPVPPPGVPVVPTFYLSPYCVPMLPQPSSPSSSSGLNSTTLGKHSRDETSKELDSATLSNSRVGGIFYGFQPKGHEKIPIYEPNSVLPANPAALSGSLHFHEST